MERKKNGNFISNKKCRDSKNSMYITHLYGSAKAP